MTAGQLCLVRRANNLLAAFIRFLFNFDSYQALFLWEKCHWCVDKTTDHYCTWSVNSYLFTVLHEFSVLNFSTFNHVHSAGFVHSRNLPIDRSEFVPLSWNTMVVLARIAIELIDFQLWNIAWRKLFPTREYLNNIMKERTAKVCPDACHDMSSNLPFPRPIAIRYKTTQREAPWQIRVRNRCYTSSAIKRWLNARLNFTWNTQYSVYYVNMLAAMFYCSNVNWIKAQANAAPL